MQLSKEDEVTEETAVRREDQEKINRFSRLHQRATVLEEQLGAKQVGFSLCPFMPVPQTNLMYGAYYQHVSCFGPALNFLFHS
jgi:hypothetical protein